MASKIVVSVSSDLVTDQRVERVCATLMDMGYSILLVGRKLKKNTLVKRDYRMKRMRLLFTSGPLFYAGLNIRLFLLLIKERPDILLANDLDTLLANFLYHRLSFRKTKLVYDSHEYFTEVPELIGRSSRKVWLRMERWIFPKLKHVYTVSSSIAEAYSNAYHVPVATVRNLPLLSASADHEDNLFGSKKLIYQGAINVHRGIELMVEMMWYLPDYHLYIFGDGDIADAINELIISLDLSSRIQMMGRKSPSILRGYTKQCNLGLSFEEDRGLSYRYSLPNKVFDYIHAGIPVLCSDLPQMKQIVDDYKVGEVLRDRQAQTVASQVRSICEEETKNTMYRSNSLVAKKILCWEEEEKKLRDILQLLEKY